MPRTASRPIRGRRSHRARARDRREAHARATRRPPPIRWSAADERWIALLRDFPGGDLYEIFGMPAHLLFGGVP